MTADEVERAATLLVAARRDGAPLACLPPPSTPSTREQAYAIQDAVARHLGPIGAWKSGPPTPEEGFRCAPIFASGVLESPATLAAGKLVAPTLEVEIAFRIGRDLGNDTYDSGSIAGFVASMHPAIEVVASRFRDRQALGPLSRLADNVSNEALVIGPPAADWQSVNLEHQSASLVIDGVTAAEVPQGPGLEALLDVVAWVANHRAAQGAGLAAGDYVTTGSRTGQQPFGPNAAAVATLPGLGEARITFVP